MVRMKSVAKKKKEIEEKHETEEELMEKVCMAETMKKIRRFKLENKKG